MKHYWGFISFCFVVFFFNNNISEEIVLPNAVPLDIKKNLVKVKVAYINYNNKLQEGYLIVNKSVEKEVKAIFDTLLANNFPINKISSMENYNWDDNKSMQDNNTSAFNYRYNAHNKQKLSKHAYGLAIDINPLDNPVIYKGKTSPPNAVYDISRKGTIGKNSIVVKIFKKFGWKWGGDYSKIKDYQHFEK